MTSDASLFGLALPAFAAIDRLMAGVMGPLPRLLAWGCLMAVVTMILYRLISPQRRIQALKAEAAAARRQIAGFDGEFDQLTPLIRRSLSASLRQVATILWPALLASLPLVSCLMWLYSAYNFQAPAAGQAIPLEVEPAPEALRSDPVVALLGTDERLQLSWPAAGLSVALFDRQGTRLAAIGGQPASDRVEHFAWWNRLIGNPAGYVPSGSPVERVRFELPQLELIATGPRWLRGWEAPFFLTLIVASLLIKLLFRIE